MSTKAEIHYLMKNKASEKPRKEESRTRPVYVLIHCTFE